MSNPTQNAGLQKQELSPEDRCQALMDTVVDMRVRYPAYITILNEKAIKINVTMLKRRFKAHREVKFPTPKYNNIDISFNSQDFDKLKTSFKQQREILKKLKTLKTMAKQIKNDRIGRILNEDIDSETIIKRVEQKLDEKKQTRIENV